MIFSDLYDHLLPELPGCTTAMVDLHLLHTARDYCERTSCWRASLAIASGANVATYNVTLIEPDSEIVRITRLEKDTVVLWSETWDRDSDETEPKYRRDLPPFTMNDENTELTFITGEVPTAVGVANIKLTAALKPAFNATTLPDLLKNQHLEAMRTGTLQRLMQMGSKKWTDRALAGKYGGDYMALCSHAANNAQLGNTRRLLRVRKAGF